MDGTIWGEIGKSPLLIFDLSHIDARDLRVWVSQGPLCLYGTVQIVLHSYLMTVVH